MDKENLEKEVYCDDEGGNIKLKDCVACILGDIYYCSHRDGAKDNNHEVI